MLIMVDSGWLLAIEPLKNYKNFDDLTSVLLAEGNANKSSLASAVIAPLAAQGQRSWISTSQLPPPAQGASSDGAIG